MNLGRRAADERHAETAQRLLRLFWYFLVFPCVLEKALLSVVPPRLGCGRADFSRRTEQRRREVSPAGVSRVHAARLALVALFTIPSWSDWFGRVVPRLGLGPFPGRFSWYPSRFRYMFSQSALLSIAAVDRTRSFPASPRACKNVAHVLLYCRVCCCAGSSSGSSSSSSRTKSFCLDLRHPSPIVYRNNLWICSLFIYLFIYLCLPAGSCSLRARVGEQARIPSCADVPCFYFYVCVYIFVLFSKDGALAPCLVLQSFFFVWYVFFGLRFGSCCCCGGAVFLVVFLAPVGDDCL